MWNLISVHLEIVLVSVQDRSTVCIKRTTAQKSFWTHPMELLDDVRHVESHFGLFADSASVSARYVHDLHQTYHRLKHKLISVHFETMLVSVQDMFMICAKCTTCSKIIVDAHDETAR
jgi:hypothetical protein